MPQTANQSRSVEAILAKAQEYMDHRFRQVARVNPKIEAVWDDLSWQQLMRLRFTISQEKAFGAQRFHVAETLLTDDFSKIREFFSTKSQVSLQAEIVESKELEGQKTTGMMEIHDMRTLCKAIDPDLEATATLIQTFMWWDLQDAVDLARADRKASTIATLEKHELTDAMKEHYQKLMGTEDKVDNEAAILYECRMFTRTVERFRLRLAEQPGYQMIVAREAGANEDSDKIIEAIASQNQFLRSIRAGGDIDNNTREQFSKALKCEPDEVTNERAAGFLEQTIQGNKERLRRLMLTGGSGKNFALKHHQMEMLSKMLKDAVKDRDLTMKESAE